MSIVASHIGLPAKDTVLLKSMINMLMAAKRLPFTMEFVDFNEYVSTKRIPSILFVNLDYDKAMSLWRKIKVNFPETIGVFLTSDQTGMKGLLERHIITRPVTLRQVMSTIEDIDRGEQQEDEFYDISKLNVLIVDDSYLMRKYMENTLPFMVDERLNIDNAQNGKEAIEKVNKKVYDLVFLDVVMPEIDGYQVCKYIKRHYDSYVVMLTSRKSKLDKVRGTMSDCDTYMVKPPNEKVIQHILESCLFQNLVSNTGMNYAYSKGVHSTRGIVDHALK
jgi:CheY-like chemotaxis protein